MTFDLYGGVSGLYDYGPPGCAFQNNIIDAWRKHFILEEDMLEVDCTMLTPYEVLKTSGHVDKFSDWMCRDLKTGEIFRADHLVEEVLEARLKVKLDDDVVKEYEEILAKIDGYSGPELGELMEKYDIGNPVTGETLESPRAFNLMFETAIGPSGQLKGYLRPETAQGQFLNFNKLLEFNNSKTPFASASIGKSFRNEISPRAGLLRVREFLMAEIEHFVDPLDKSHPKFNEIKDIKLSFLPRDVQEAGSTEPIVKTVGEAVASRMVDNETLGYFIARIYQFLMKIGVDESKLRFRQHMANEMAHYAADCWDGELKTSYGWIECVGCADRSAYDLTVHSKKTKEKLVVRQKLDNPIEVTKWEIDLTKKIVRSKIQKRCTKS
ncbi:CPS_collapsed_G0003210.mRNA.1.CDS.1 [Saccharomyces cerevisiae]|nr:CPS_collapsed_G0003210.mRNA.1.CDS.1 [Saccharomyces cerevisiae]